MSNLRAKGVIRTILELGTMEHNVVLSTEPPVPPGALGSTITGIGRRSLCPNRRIALSDSPTDGFTMGCTRRPVDDLCREALIVADLSALPRRRGIHTPPVASQGNGRHGTHARRA